MRFAWLFAVLAVAAVVLLQPTHAAVAAIDFGSEWLKVALVKTGVPMEIVLNRESKRKTPIVLTIRNNERHFGEDAVALSGRFPKETFTNLLDVLGKQFDEPATLVYRERHVNPVEVDANRTTLAFSSGSDEPWLVEELTAMVLKFAKSQAEAMAGERIKDTVITVPPFFNQFERQALLDAAELAGFNVLRLLSSDAAIALHYGITKKYNVTPEYNIFYDMGAASTKVSLVSFSTIKDTKTKKPVTQFEVLGVAYDRHLGGAEFDYRLQKHIGEQFMKQKGVKNDVFKSERARTKLLKEANRVKQILSANADTFSRIESLLDDVDVNVRVTRAEFENLCADLFERVPKPLNELLQKTSITLDQVTSIVLVGGGVRIPKIQAVLKAAVGRELAQNINGDEAAVLGAAFKGAELSRQFKVKEIRLLDVSVLPISVTYTPVEQEIAATTEGVSHKVIYPEFTALGKRRQMTFLRDAPFNFTVNEQDDAAYPAREIFQVHVDGFDSENVKTFSAINKAPSPKVLVTFELDESGTIHVEKAEAIFEVPEVQKIKAAPKPKKDPTMLENIYNMFGMGDKEDDKKEAKKDGGADEVAEGEEEIDSDAQQQKQQQQQQQQQQEEQQEQETKEHEEADKKEEQKKDQTEEQKNESSSEDQKAQDTSSSSETTETPTKEAEQKTEEKEEEKTEEVVKTKRVRLTVAVGHGKPQPLSKAQKASGKAKIAALDELEAKAAHHNEIVNKLEALVYRLRDRLENKQFKDFSTAAERELIKSKSNDAGKFLEDNGQHAETAQYEQLSKELLGLVEPVEFRVEESTRRPNAIDNLKKGISTTRSLVKNATEMPEEDRAFEADDLKRLNDTTNRVAAWLEEKEAAQATKAVHEVAAVTTDEVHEQTVVLQRELRSFSTRMKAFKKKASDKEKKEKDKDSKKKTKDTKKPKVVAEEVDEDEVEEDSKDKVFDEEEQQQQQQQQQSNEQEDHHDSKPPHAEL